MWRDIILFSKVEIPAATSGMPRKSAPDAPEKFVVIQDIVKAAQIREAVQCYRKNLFLE